MKFQIAIPLFAPVYPYISENLERLEYLEDTAEQPELVKDVEE